MMNRRAFIGTLAGGLLTAPLAAEAQRAGKVPRIGFLRSGPPPQAFVEGFQTKSTLECRCIADSAGRRAPAQRRKREHWDQSPKGVGASLHAGHWAGRRHSRGQSNRINQRGRRMQGSRSTGRSRFRALTHHAARVETDTD